MAKPKSRPPKSPTGLQGLDELEGTDRQQILVFVLDGPRYALCLSAVERVVRAVEITPLPKAPPLVLGVINVQGQVIPVMDIRPCFGQPAREVHQDDRFILARAPRQLVALVADSVVGIHELAAREMVDTGEVVPGAPYIHGLVKLEGDLILVCDLDQFLSFDFEAKLEAALK